MLNKKAIENVVLGIVVGFTLISIGLLFYGMKVQSPSALVVQQPNFQPQACQLDCDDSDPNVNPGITENSQTGNCNDDKDNDCDGDVDCADNGCNNDPACVPVCGNGIVDPGEQCDPPGSQCMQGQNLGICTAADTQQPCSCNTALCQECGNGICDFGENQQNCNQDCDPVCGNDVCEQSANEGDTCPQDCQADCGNGICEGGQQICQDGDCDCPGQQTTCGETQGSCPADCSSGTECSGNGICQQDPEGGPNPEECPEDCCTDTCETDDDCPTVGCSDGSCNTDTGFCVYDQIEGCCESDQDCGQCEKCDVTCVPAPEKCPPQTGGGGGGGGSNNFYEGCESMPLFDSNKYTESQWTCNNHKDCQRISADYICGKLIRGNGVECRCGEPIIRKAPPPGTPNANSNPPPFSNYGSRPPPPPQSGASGGPQNYAGPGQLPPNVPRSYPAPRPDVQGAMSQQAGSSVPAGIGVMLLILALAAVVGAYFYKDIKAYFGKKPEPIVQEIEKSWENLIKPHKKTLGIKKRKK